MSKKHNKKPSFFPKPPIIAQPPNSDKQEQEKLVPLDLKPIIDNLRVRENRNLLKEIASKRNNNQLISLVIRDNVPLKPDIILPLFDILQSVGKQEKIDLFLSTTGGATEIPWRIVSLLREFCSQYTAIIPFLALSAGTHIALGANSLLMSEISTLGPVDPTTRHPLQPVDKSNNPVPMSVEDLKNCIKFITQQLENQSDGQKYSPTDMVTIVGKLFEHIEPLAIGAVERAYALSRLITKKVLETHLHPENDKAKIQSIVDKIGGEYFSHAFPITRRDVENELTLKVEKPDNALTKAIWDLHLYYRGAFQFANHLSLNVQDKEKKAAPKQLNFAANLLGFIDSVAERCVLLQLREPFKDEKTNQVAEREVLTTWVKINPQQLPANDPRFFAIEIKNPT